MIDPIIITSYDPTWPVLFSGLGTTLRAALGNTALRIDHIGSTSIPGLAAKPIIDIQISVASFDPLDAYRLPLENLGFIYRTQNPDLTKRYFREAPGERRTHIHVRRAGSWAEQFTLLFRDYLRVHPDEANHYAEVKYRLALQYRNERERYVQAKLPCIWAIMAKADQWNQEIGWTPGPADA